jgi:hypothetical protein
MNTAIKSAQKRFYILSIDLLQGIMIVWFVVGHTGLWWDGTIENLYPNVPPIISLFITLALIIPPGFLFLYAFNTANSLLRRKTAVERKKSRYHLIKRGIIFFLVAEIAEITSALVTQPQYLLNAILTWELFTQFSFTTFFVLFVFELAWILESQKKWDYKKIIIVELISCIAIVLTLFSIFHDYTQTTIIESLFVDLNLDSILQRAVFEVGQAPIIPFIAFSATGALMAVYIDLPNEKRHTIIAKMKKTLVISSPFIIYGLLQIDDINRLMLEINKLFQIEFINILLQIIPVEKYLSPVLSYPASSPLVFISVGVLPTTMVILMYILDIDSLYSRQSINKIILPIIVLSRITLTVYIVHNFAYIIPPDLPILEFLIQDIHIALLAGIFYAMFFVAIAFIWQKWKYKYSIEWIIWRVTKKS